MPRTLLALVATSAVLWTSVAPGTDRGVQNALLTPPAPRPVLTGFPPRDQEGRDWTPAGRISRPHDIMNACAGANSPSYWTKKLQAEDPHTRATAAQALGEFREEAVVPALVRALNDQDREVRLAVVKALGRIGPRARAAAPALTRMRADADPELRAEVAGTLRKLDE